MIADLVAVIDININPEIFSGAFALTWHGVFTAIAIAVAVWLALRLGRRVGISEDDALTIALVAVPSGIVGARLLWVFEHTNQIGNVGDLFALTDGGISIYGGVIGGVIGGLVYVLLFRPGFPKWVILDVAAPGMIVAQGIGRLGDFVNGEHFAKATDLPWAFRYTHPNTDGPWAAFAGSEPVGDWFRGQIGQINEAAIAVHPVAGGYEPLLDFLIFGVLLVMRRTRILPGWGFVFYVAAYALVRGLLALLRTDEQTVFGGALSVPQLLALLTGFAALVMAWYLYRHPQPPLVDVDEQRTARRDRARTRRDGGGQAEPRGTGPRIRPRRDRYRG